MSNKPSDAVRWSVDGSDNDAANITIPTATQQDTGWTLGQKPSSGLFNWLANRSYRWFKWLSDGDCLFHNLSANGSLTLTGNGATTLGGALTVTGKATLNNTLDVAGNTTLHGTLSVTGNTALSGTLIAGGNTTLGGSLQVGGQTLTFTNFTFTANSTSDQLTAVGHPLQTGDGPVRAANAGGALPGGLAAATDYWVIFVDINNFKLATSFANAMAGVAIDITTFGSGTQTLLSQSGTKRATDATITRNLAVNGALSVAGNTALTTLAAGALQFSTLSPPTIGSGATVNDYSPDGIATASLVALIAEVNGGGILATITGLNAGINTSRLILLANAGVPPQNTISLAHEDTRSLPQNRFHLENISAISLPLVTAVLLRYDNTIQRWRAVITIPGFSLRSSL